MKTQSDEQYLQVYVDFLNKIINETMSDSRLNMRAGESQDLREVTRTQGRTELPLQLRGGFLSFRQLIRRHSVEGEDRVVVEQAVYIFSPTGDLDGDWLFRYEYDRTPVTKYPHSHFHINSPELDRFHFPADRLSIEQIFAHLMLERGVQPKSPLTVDAALDILAVTHREFQKRRTDIHDAPFP